MSACMILAVRPKMLEGLFGGLDKMYRLHKWLGIIALSGSILHWTSTQFPKWLITLGVIEGKRPQRPPLPDILTLKDWLVSQRHFAEEVGEVAFYAVGVLLLIALIKLIPYRWFARLHILIVPVYLALVWHAIVLANFAYWSQPLGWLLAAALFFGSTYSSAVFVRSSPSLNALANRKPRQ
ncbi:ferric reductase-like transmembrane domain-containing protein [Neisseria bergeri]|uniref:ferric reductase-like transmembrane domain-containing protein n=1 Tax=Neisseria bergeri TaxID=1906581 RepID=UPI00272B163D|nr:ferric reductase-like transmembrane domain-containing protein [Neisseria bergeri]